MPPIVGAMAGANAAFHELTGELESQLKPTGFLVGGRTTNADLAVASLANLSMLSAEAVQANPILGFFREHLHLGEGRDGTRAWIERNLALDH